MPPYIKFDDRYIQLMHRWNQHGHPLPKTLFGKVFVAVYRPDEMEQMVNEFPPHTPSSLPETLEAAEQLLDASMTWLENTIFAA